MQGSCQDDRLANARITIDLPIRESIPETADLIERLRAYNVIGSYWFTSGSEDRVSIHIVFLGENAKRFLHYAEMEVWGMAEDFLHGKGGIDDE